MSKKETAESFDSAVCFGKLTFDRSELAFEPETEYKILSGVISFERKGTT